MPNLITFENPDGLPLLLFATRTERMTHPSQVFFTGPEEDQLIGRVLLGRGPLMGAVYPLYFRIDLNPTVVPGAQHRASCR